MPKTHALTEVLKAIGWKDIGFVMVCSLLAGHYLVVHQEPESSFELLQLPAYYPALLGSFCIAFVVSSCIRIISFYLDLRWPWIRNFNQRLLLQVLFGILMMVALAFVLATIYFALRGAQILEMDYYRQDFWLVVILICFLNLFLVAEYAFRALFIFMAPPAEHFAEIDEALVEKEDVPLEDLAWTKIAYIYHKDRFNWTVDFNGSREHQPLTLKKLLTVLPKQYFFRLQKGFIINIKAIDLIKSASSRRLMVYLKVPINKDLPTTLVGLLETNFITRLPYGLL